MEKVKKLKVIHQQTEKADSESKFTDIPTAEILPDYTKLTIQKDFEERYFNANYIFAYYHFLNRLKIHVVQI